MAEIFEIGLKTFFQRKLPSDGLINGDLVRQTWNEHLSGSEIGIQTLASFNVAAMAIESKNILGYNYVWNCWFVSNENEINFSLRDLGDVFCKILHHRGPDDKGIWIDKITKTY